MNDWGFNLVDKIIWVKLTAKNKLHVTPGYYFLHSTEVCLVGVKATPGVPLQYVPKVSSEVIIANVREKARKPDELYWIVEQMMPGARKLELFARNHNIRKGWMAVGNELGKRFEWRKDSYSCNGCNKAIGHKQARYKAMYVLGNESGASFMEHRR
eukprot:TRINITY_DN1096_c0_g2_i3.p1 TRINITY_DN1096_c0_g2~~TRINITY_DN1096_c0_g2_i3.p1  ORF type:complete len:156 (-),score=51.10 TRINITY_DN1096_c0_g2_i3:27-494(-)